MAEVAPGGQPALGRQADDVCSTDRPTSVHVRLFALRSTVSSTRWTWRASSKDGLGSTPVARASISRAPGG